VRALLGLVLTLACQERASTELCFCANWGSLPCPPLPSGPDCTLIVSNYHAYPMEVEVSFSATWEAPVKLAGLTDGGSAGPVQSARMTRWNEPTFFYMRGSEGTENRHMFGWLTVLEGDKRCEARADFIVPSQGTGRR